MNYLIWLGVAKDNGIDYEFTGCDGNFMTMQWCQIDGYIPVNKNHQIQSLEGNIPAFVHQYNRIENLTREFINIVILLLIQLFIIIMLKILFFCFYFINRR